jgi:hypothetical protein
MGEPGRITHHDPDPRAALSAGADVLDAAIVKRDHRATPVLGKNLGELAARGQGLS